MAEKIRTITFTLVAWEDYQYWVKQDRKVVKRINALIRDILRNPYEGIGKPEALRFELGGLWSRRIDSEHRLVYQVDGQTLIVFQCRYHYS